MTKDYGPAYPDGRQRQAEHNSIKISAWISPALKGRIQAILRPYGGHMSTLIRRLLEDWARETAKS